MSRALSREGFSPAHGASSTISPSLGFSPKNDSSLRRNHAWNEVLEICKKGFGNKMSSMGDEILQQVRVELQQNASAVRHEVESMFRMHAAQEDAKFSELSRGIQKVADVAECGLLKSVGSSSIDLSPMLDEFRSNEIHRAENDRKFHQQIKDEVSGINENFLTLTKRSQLGEEKVHELTSRMLELETQLATLSDFQSALSSKSDKLAVEIKKAEFDRHSQGTSLSDKLDALSSQIKSTGQDQRISREVAGVTSEVKKTCNIVLNEIGKIQQALHLDFVQRREAEEAEQEMKAFEKMNLGIPDFIAMFRENDNFVTKVAATTGLPEYELRELGDESLLKWFVQMDTDRSGTLDFKEFIDGINQIVKARAEPGATPQKRVREFSVQTDAADLLNKATQIEPRMLGAEKVRNAKSVRKPDKSEPPKKAAFADAEGLKKKARAALISKPVYNVFNCYHKNGVCQKIAKHSYFENCTMAFVCLNAVWLAVDTDNNPAPFLTSAEPIFVVAENLFCFYFFAELLIRFLAFEYKVNALKDSWFIFDLVLVLLMTAETWIAPLVITALDLDVTSGGMIDISTVKLVKLVKIMRLSRLAKLLRMMPELVIIMKGIGFASRSVSVFLLFWIVIIYMFAILLTELTREFDIGQQHFPGVLPSMNTLLLAGVIPDQTRIVNDLGDASWYLWPIIVAFVLLCSLTIMYMLVGVLVDVVGVIAASEKEAMTVQFIASSLRQLMQDHYECRCGYHRTDGHAGHDLRGCREDWR
eukprot:TRINITY_DN7936_c0_g2_i1.p1 TRINITY_DN7936_c0_g2~~TRINITY_DN7936_c0_g2_i1.p1  ORF type:complete len:759 (+),score=148.15 TRINITY_DN7936_c0_g2_i1:75-2351(+)